MKKLLVTTLLLFSAFAINAGTALAKDCHCQCAQDCQCACHKKCTCDKTCSCKKHKVLFFFKHNDCNGKCDCGENCTCKN